MARFAASPEPPLGIGIADTRGPAYACGCAPQSYDYKIKLEHVKRLYLLPEIDEKHMMFVVRGRPTGMPEGSWSAWRLTVRAS